MSCNFWIRATLCAGAIAIAPSLVDAKPSDAWVTTKTKMALMSADGIDTLDVNVDTVRGHVTLHGKVESAAERTRAEEVARKIDGVRDVRNLLQVVPDTSKKRVEASDDQIEEAVEHALEAEASLAGSSIDVKSVNQGVVLLGGKAASLTDALVALRLARHTPGVRRVASEMVTAEKLSDAEVWRADKVAAADAKKNESGSKLKDMWITSAVKMRLLADGDTPAMDINVDTTDGVVTLFGIVPSDTARTAAEANAAKTDGVKRVANALQVVAKSEEKAVKALDADLEKQVEAEIEGDEDLKAASIHVEVKDQVVRLTGTVPSHTGRLQAALAARSVGGVRAVREELQIKVN